MGAVELMRHAGYAVERVIHVGANTGQERHYYSESGANPCIYVEPIEDVYQILKRNLMDLPGHIAVQAVCAEAEGRKIKFNISSNGGESSSFLGLGVHAELFPNIVYTSSQEMLTTTLDKVVNDLDLAKAPDLVVMDTQGTELQVLMGATKTLSNTAGLFLEVSEEPLYEGGCTFEEVTDFVSQFGLRLRWTELNLHGFGDAFFARKRPAASTLPVYDGNLAIGRTASQSSQSVWSKPDDAQGAVNGSRNGGYGFHTAKEPNPWWEVDLGGYRKLSEIRVYNRTDAGRDRSRTLRILTSNDHISWDLVHDQRGYTFSGVDGEPLRVIVDGLTARYVRLQLAETNFLHLDEIEVY